ncbi:uncharacterized protein LOC127752262 [Frankliniella occidentalis]|uniref:Uncharacterized protein LOC127752262 n=1 Tax=Frankliniella occidentalis TaxID=133901 RepID=A0A9C6XW71_FRAOC|nr:uncharacterized protein LOC127752262 [Frankliniella occidentalis]
MSNVATTTASPSASTPTTLSTEAPTTTGPRQPTPEEEADCTSQIGVVENGVHISTMRKYDMEKILEEHGGAPGKLNVTWNMDVPEFPVEDPTVKPLPDTVNTTFWVYDYKSTDFKTYVRTEHALLRNKGQKDQYLDIRGELYWTPPDFCNKARHATYSQNQTGVIAHNVGLSYCAFEDSSRLYCEDPANCIIEGDSIRCVKAPSSALIASLVG